MTCPRCHAGRVDRDDATYEVPVYRCDTPCGFYLAIFTGEGTMSSDQSAITETS